MSPPSFTIVAHGRTDVGMKRRLNEDFFIIDDDLGLYLVADGMGGHAAGDVASRLAGEEILDSLRDARDAGDRRPARDLLTAAVVAGQRRLVEAVRREPELKGMGTTVVAALHPPGSGKLVIAHVGDSRAYRFRNGDLEPLTEDHSWVHEQVTAGFLSEEAARRHPLKNVVTRALGENGEPRVDTRELELEAGDRYLLCSDGLNTMLEDREIAAVLRRTGDLEAACRELIVAANRRGGNDNITVVLLDVTAA